jgi:mannosyl-3-phosphoglycerate phosphatase
MNTGLQTTDTAEKRSSPQLGAPPEALVEMTEQHPSPSLSAAWWPSSGALASRVSSWRSGRIDPEGNETEIVVFGDPDTLRGEGATGWAQTRGAVRALEDHGMAVVLWGNETRSQMEVIQRDLNLHHPFISETGAGLFVPHGYFRDDLVGGRYTPHYRVVDFGKPYHHVSEALREVARKVGTGIIRFSDMSIQDVAQTCALSLSQARLATLREYDEPFRMLDSEPAVYSRLCTALRRLGVRTFTHETFHHATAVANTTQSLRLLTSLYREASGGPVLTIGLAKARSETGLLECVDVPIVVEGNPADAARLVRKVPTARFTTAAGSRGWCEAILESINGHRISRRGTSR